jgi:hypothetical protein
MCWALLSKSAHGWTLPAEVIEFAAVLVPPIQPTTSAPGVPPSAPEPTSDTTGASHATDELQARLSRLRTRSTR